MFFTYLYILVENDINIDNKIEETIKNIINKDNYEKLKNKGKIISGFIYTIDPELGSIILVNNFVNNIKFEINWINSYYIKSIYQHKYLDKFCNEILINLDNKIIKF